MRQQAWNAFKPLAGERFKLLDTIFFDPSMDAEDVKRALVEHDGFPANIIVRKDG